MLGRKAVTNLDSVLKSKDITLLTKVSIVKVMFFFFSSHVWMWELDHKEGWVPKHWCFQSVVLEKILDGSLDCMEIKAVNPKGNQPWIFTGRTDAEAEAPILSSCDMKSHSLEKTTMWGRLKAKGEEDGRGWDGEIAPLTQWTWI